MTSPDPVMAVDPAGGIPILFVPNLPEGTMLVLNDQHRWTDHLPAEIMWERDLWGPPKVAPASDPAIRQRAVDARREALTYLASRLDDACRRLGWDPQEVWRDPRIRERDRKRQDWIVYQRIGLLINNPRDYAKITIVP